MKKEAIELIWCRFSAILKALRLTPMPMAGQDEMNNILCETYPSNIKRTFGGISFNGIYQMNDDYSFWSDADAWMIFGDPSLMVRTDAPETMNVTHNQSFSVGTTSIAVGCNVNGASVAITEGYSCNILGTGTIAGGTANIAIPALTAGDSVRICVTAYNKIPYIYESWTVGIDDSNDDNFIEVYPNPSKGQFNINFSQNRNIKYNIKVVDILGKEIYSEQTTGNGTQGNRISLDDAEDGIYFLVIESNSVKITKKIVVQK